MRVIWGLVEQSHRLFAISLSNTAVWIAAPSLSSGLLTDNYHSSRLTSRRLICKILLPIVSHYWPPQVYALWLWVIPGAVDKPAFTAQPVQTTWNPLCSRDRDVEYDYRRPWCNQIPSKLSQATYFVSPLTDRFFLRPWKQVSTTASSQQLSCQPILRSRWWISPSRQ